MDQSRPTRHQPGVWKAWLGQWTKFLNSKSEVLQAWNNPLQHTTWKAQTPGKIWVQEVNKENGNLAKPKRPRCYFKPQSMMGCVRAILYKLHVKTFRLRKKPLQYLYTPLIQQQGTYINSLKRIGEHLLRRWCPASQCHLPRQVLCRLLNQWYQVEENIFTKTRGKDFTETRWLSSLLKPAQ